MKLLIQRVRQASVSIDQKIVGQIDQGILAFLGVSKTDTEAQVKWIVNKLINLRIFPDENDKMNLSILDKNYSILIISQFTLYANCQKGNRPSFIDSADPSIAKPLYESFIEQVKDKKIDTQTGRFGANMQVSLINDGPVTLLIETP